MTEGLSAGRKGGGKIGRKRNYGIEKYKKKGEREIQRREKRAIK